MKHVLILIIVLIGLNRAYANSKSIKIIQINENNQRLSYIDIDSDLELDYLIIGEKSGFSTLWKTSNNQFHRLSFKQTLYVQTKKEFTMNAQTNKWSLINEQIITKINELEGLMTKRHLNKKGKWVETKKIIDLTQLDLWSYFSNLANDFITSINNDEDKDEDKDEDIFYSTTILWKKCKQKEIWTAAQDLLPDLNNVYQRFAPQLLDGSILNINNCSKEDKSLIGRALKKGIKCLGNAMNPSFAAQILGVIVESKNMSGHKVNINCSTSLVGVRGRAYTGCKSEWPSVTLLPTGKYPDRAVLDKDIDNAEFMMTAFHEVAHLTGIVHGDKPDLVEACSLACFGDLAPQMDTIFKYPVDQKTAIKSAKKICRGTKQDDKSYYEDLYNILTVGDGTSSYIFSIILNFDTSQVTNMFYRKYQDTLTNQKDNILRSNLSERTKKAMIKNISGNTLKGVKELYFLHHLPAHELIFYLAFLPEKDVEIIRQYVLWEDKNPDFFMPSDSISTYRQRQGMIPTAMMTPEQFAELRSIAKLSQTDHVLFLKQLADFKNKFSSHSKIAKGVENLGFSYCRKNVGTFHRDEHRYCLPFLKSAGKIP